jgi:hypothetical protein
MSILLAMGNSFKRDGRGAAAAGESLRMRLRGEVRPTQERVGHGMEGRFGKGKRALQRLAEAQRAMA